jgi:hypothetical protein
VENVSNTGDLIGEYEQHCTYDASEKYPQDLSHPTPPLMGGLFFFVVDYLYKVLNGAVYLL